MAIIKVSETVKQELEELKTEKEFKSLDAVIRYHINSFVEVNGGIFLGSDGGEVIKLVNVRRSSTMNNFTHLFISPPTTIKLYKCLKCQTTTIQNEGELIVVPNCAGCGKGMTPITIQIGLEQIELEDKGT